MQESGQRRAAEAVEEVATGRFHFELVLPVRKRLLLLVLADELSTAGRSLVNWLFFNQRVDGIFHLAP
jgi:hypothetical protein